MTSLLKSEQIDVDECKPCDYRINTQERNLNCTRPLYLLNEISILSTFDIKRDYNLSNLLNVYHWSCFVVLAVCVLLFILISSLKSTLWKSIWAYIDPLIGRYDNTTFKSFSYTFYLLALIPFIEIIRNELLASLVTMKEVKSDTLDDLLDPEITVFMFREIKYWKNESRLIADELLERKFDSLFEKSTHSSLGSWFEMFNNPDQLKKKVRRMACLHDEFSIKMAKVGLKF